ncbi:hypothetical protein PE067_10755 [Paracoccus sp. DMF-8]|uniref:hypothetical protein n=1 Tax=Paracoccus sp. DMF-8 TaxID=3019445 RepID=UPI0023E856D4|nr:hypothetical protein [Paracoccus sp. DMF-8]MDF3606581.1 hypothetical protein [Paracoccus sp. DMF-8]
MANRIIVTDADLTGDTIRFVQRTALPQTISGTAAGTWHVLNTAMSGPVEVLGLPGQLRAASTDASTTINSGHSLTDAYAAWHTSVRDTMQTLGITDPHGAKFAIATMPGSSMAARWGHGFDVTWPEGGYFGNGRTDIYGFDTLMITEAGPPVPIENTASRDIWLRQLDYLCRFSANAIENGKPDFGTEVVFWSIWPDAQVWASDPSSDYNWWRTNYPNFRDALVKYGEIFRHMTDYAAWKMRQLYPGLPEDWRIWIIPGHLWMRHLYDDIAAEIAPGYTTIADAFTDGIHPTPASEYGLHCFVLTCLYQLDIAAYDALHGGVRIPAGMTRQQAEYYWALALRVAQEYEPAGWGGTEGGEIEYDPLITPDWLPDWTFDGTDVVTGAPEADGLPVISGDTLLGETLTATPPNWLGYPAPTSTSGLWSTSPDGVTWTPTTETGTTITLLLEHVGLVLRYSATATNSVGPTTVHSLPTDPVVDDTVAALPSDHVLHMTATDHDGPALTGTAPTAVDGVLRFARYAAVDDAPRVALTATEMYLCMAVRPTGTGNTDLMTANNRTNDPWTDNPNKTAASSPNQGSRFEANYFQSGPAPTVNRAPEGSYVQGDWHVVEFFWDAVGTTVRVIHDNTDYGDTAAPYAVGATLAETTTLWLHPVIGAGDPVATDVAELVVYDRIPTPAERASIRAVMAESVPT